MRGESMSLFHHLPLPILFGLGFGTILLLLPGYIWRRRQRRRYSVLVRQVTQYRLSKMLTFLGITLKDYLRHVPEPIVLRQISVCDACDNVAQCDACLRDRQFTTSLHFCPNFNSLMHCSQWLSPDASP